MIADVVYEALQMRGDSLDRLSSAIQLHRVRSYKRAWNYLAQAAGTRSRVVLDDNVVSKLRQASYQDAQQISNTYNRDLRKAVDALAAAHPDATAKQLGLLVNDWNSRREEFKAPQISMWAAGDARREAQNDFFRANPTIEGRARVVPLTAAEPGCEAMIAEGWQPLARASEWKIPLHPNCEHQVEFELTPVETPQRTGLLGNIWTGLMNRLRGNR